MPAGSRQTLVTRHPAGVEAISPWNLPTSMIKWRRPGCSPAYSVFSQDLRAELQTRRDHPPVYRVHGSAKGWQRTIKGY
ncbi:MAG: hypothetical protein OXE85_07270 [Roseovarius sp.]|nr:hypothetical protein [Roseovarius sp.]MCY4314848.1 hypothetical protein [Roseovarius sp.]